MTDRDPGARRSRATGWPRLGRGLALACILASSGGCLATAAAPAASAAARRHPAHARLTIRHLHRPGLAGASEVWIYRPGVPDSARLPVVYFLHGHPGEPADIFRAGLSRVMDRYIARGGTPFVIAAPDGNSSLHADTEWGDASDGSDEVESFLLDTVIPAVEGSHPRTPARRAIAGFSMGGFGAMNIALRHPDRFGQIVSIAGYFQLDDPSQMFATPAARGANTPTANIAQARGKRILLLEDRDDPLALIRGQSLAFKGLLEQAGTSAVWLQSSGAHDLAYAISQMPIVARFLGRGFAAAAGA